jgi:hypothetical protein
MHDGRSYDQHRRVNQQKLMVDVVVQAKANDEE